LQPADSNDSPRKIHKSGGNSVSWTMAAHALVPHKETVIRYPDIGIVDPSDALKATAELKKDLNKTRFRGVQRRNLAQAQALFTAAFLVQVNSFLDSFDLSLLWGNAFCCKWESRTRVETTIPAIPNWKLITLNF
jgi:hypothetical protein